jgi:anti-anti-sigma factor
MSASVKILEPSGILDGIRGHELRFEINAAVNAGTDIVLIDLKNIKFMDSSGLGTLVSATKIVRSAGRKLFLCSVNGQIKMLFDLTKTDRIFEKFADQDEFKRQILAIQ